MGRLSDSLHVDGHLSAKTMSIPAASIDATNFKGNAEILKSHHKRRNLDPFPLALENARQHDSPATVLTAASSGDHLAIQGATFGTNAAVLTPGNVAASTIVRYARWPRLILPLEYDDGATIKIRLRAYFQTEAPDGHGKLDLELQKIDGDGGVGADLVTTAEQSFATLAAADYDFEITTTGLAPGDVLDLRLKMDVADTAGTTVDPIVSNAILFADTKG